MVSDRTDGPEGVPKVGTSDKVDNAKERLEGRAKETAGAVTDDDRLRDEGRTKQTESDLKDAGEQAKDAARKVGDAFGRDR
jgi:uncharacterized protein YjbJ (UPF0337 family)